MRKNWEIVKGCERLTEGCDSCPSYWYYKKAGLDYTATPYLKNLSVPSDDQFTKIYSVALGSDLFHESVNSQILGLIFKQMNKVRHHMFEITTKRIERAYCVSKHFEWSDNIWLGVSVESSEYQWRIDYLRKTPANFKFVSVCPMLGELKNVNLEGINQVSVAQETWGLKRPMEKKWVESLEQQCKEQKVDFVMNEFQLWEAN
jgi:protein gp37